MNVFTALTIRCILTLFALLVWPLPRNIERGFGKGLGYIIYLFGYRKKVVNENIKNCLRQLDSKTQKSIAIEHYKYFGLLIVECLHFFVPTKNHYKKYVYKNTKIIGLENWDQVRKKNKGTIFVSSHLANWELMTARGALDGICITMITKILKPRWMHNKIVSRRESCGIKAAYEPRTLPVIMRALRANEAIGFVMDQYAGPPIGIPVKFFGVKVGTLAAVATLVQRTGASILPAITYRDESDNVVLDIQKELELGDLVNNVEKSTEVLAQMVESWVRKYPTQWLWTHRRFKNVVWSNDLE